MAASDLRAEGDCLMVINALKSDELSLAPVGVYFEQIHKLGLHFNSLEYFSHINRGSNGLADSLAKQVVQTCEEGESVLPF